MKRYLHFLFVLIIVFSCTDSRKTNKEIQADLGLTPTREISKQNLLVVDAVKKFGPKISPTYEKAVCTELVIEIIEKFHTLDKIDRERIRIITDDNIQDLLKAKSPIPQGVHYALVAKKIEFL